MQNNGKNNDFNGRNALITGGTSGIGKATALAFARRGARVLISGRDAARGQSVAAAIRAEGGVADFLQAELNDVESTRKLARRALDVAGRVDILVNGAGIFPFAPTAETSFDTFDDVYATNVRAPFILVAELAPKMAEHGKG